MDTLSHMIQDLTCSLCSEPYGNATTYDAFPVSYENDKCCGDCFLYQVMPARLEYIRKKKAEEAERLKKEQDKRLRPHLKLGNFDSILIPKGSGNKWLIHLRTWWTIWGNLPNFRYFKVATR